MKLYLPPITASALLASTSILLADVAAGAERRQLDAHEHGVTTLNIALEENVLAVELEGPAMNFVGFEHMPNTPEQEQAIADTLDVLNNGDVLIQANPEAGCALLQAKAKHITDAEHDEGHDDHDDHEADHDKEHDDHDDHESEGQHSEFVGEYSYECEQPDRLNELRVGLFARFELTDEVEASFIGPDLQTFESLTPSDPVLKLRR